jgi:dipeptidyl-peptidase-4
MRIPVLAVLLSIAAPVAADDLSIARLFADPPLSGPAPRALKVSPDGARVTFLRGKPENAEQLDLWEYHVGSKQTRLLVDSALLAPGDAALTDEEKARRERARIAQYSGIVEYDFSPDGKRLLFPLNGDLYLYDLGRKGAAAVRKLPGGEGGATDAKISPRGKFVSFVRERDLWLVDLDEDEAFPLTLDGDGAIANGMAEFVAQEEMGRSTGYWWAPDDSKLAYARIDESKVPMQRRFEVHADRTEVVEQRYPAAGDPNVAIELRVIALDDVRAGANAPPASEMRVGERCAVDAAHDRTLCSRGIDLGGERDIYLARVGFLDADTLWFQRQARDQRTLDLVRVALEAGEQATLLTETSKTWIDLHDALEFVNRGREFLWLSERDGARQLYAHPLDGGAPRRITNTAWPIDALLAVDEKRGLAYVSAPGPDALEKHVWAYRLDGSGEPKRLTREPGWHEAEFARDASVFVATSSDPSTPPRVRLFRADGAALATLEPNALDDGHAYAPFRAAHRAPTYGTLQSVDGQTLHYGYVTPPDFDPSRRYPVIVRYYGGPGRQFVTKAWTTGINTGLTDTLTQYWAQAGYVVFALDNRGSARRDKKFSDAIHRRMGGAEIEDQVVGLDWLAQQPWADAKRIGAFGWSYGGFQTLMLMAQAPGRVAAGVAVAPVTDWALYDTHYTERFLETPASNAEGYAQSGVFAHLDALKPPLLIVHGMADDNVLFTNTTKLMAELQARGVPFDLMTYPGGKHGLVGQATRTHVYSTIDAFFARHLKPAEE